jgi:hypothetical protein
MQMSSYCSVVVESRPPRGPSLRLTAHRGGPPAQPRPASGSATAAVGRTDACEGCPAIAFDGVSLAVSCRVCAAAVWPCRPARVSPAPAAAQSSVAFALATRRPAGQQPARRVWIDLGDRTRSASEQASELSSGIDSGPARVASPRAPGRLALARPTLTSPGLLVQSHRSTPADGGRARFGTRESAGGDEATTTDRSRVDTGCNRTAADRRRQRK